MDEAGKSECKLCDDHIKRSTTANGTVGAEAVSDCFCLEGFFQYGDRCVDVMEGVFLNVTKATLEHLPVKPGYWRTTEVSTEVVRCLVSEACVGSNSTGYYCREGHGGPYCDVCDDGFSKDVLGLCQRCDEMLSASSIVTTILLLFLLIGVGVVFKKVLYKKYKQQIRGLKATARILFVR